MTSAAIVIQLAVSVLSAVPPAADSAKGIDRLSQQQREILAELDSRWWGWSHAQSPIVPEPKSWRRLNESWSLSKPGNVVLLIGPEATPQEVYIAGMIRRELTGRHGLRCRVVNDAQAIGTGNPVICLGTLGSNARLAKLCAGKKIDRKPLQAAESYLLDFVTDEAARKQWVLLAGGDPAGCIHAGFSLMQLIKSDQGNVTCDLVAVRDFPTVRVRSLRGVGEFLGMKLQVHTQSRYFKRNVTGDEIHPDELMLPCLDRLARNRVNCFHLLSGMKNDAKLPDRLSHLVTEAHRRAIKVVGGVRPVGTQQGDRGEFPCYANEADMEKMFGHIRQYIDAGCDFLYYMADDYYRDKLKGHCSKCIARFGNLAGEQQYFLHRLVDLANEKGIGNDRILFCPTYYDVRDYGKPNVAEEYLQVFNNDPKLKGIQFTFTYLSEEAIEQRRRQFPNLRYALFYNGPRWLAYYHRSPSATAGALTEYSRNSLYFPVYFGWHSARYDPTRGWFVNTGEPVRRTFEVVIPRETARTTLLGNIANYSDSIFKGPMEYALWGHYCWNPPRHDTKQNETVIGDTLFGPGNGTTLAQLNRLMLDLTRVFFENVTPGDRFKTSLPERLALAKLLHGRLAHGYERYRKSVSGDYIPPTQNFYVKLGLESIEKCITALERCARQRGLLGMPATVRPPARYSGVVFSSHDPGEFYLSGGAQPRDALGTWINGDLYCYDIHRNKFTLLYANGPW